MQLQSDILSAQKVVILRHTKADYDAVGSQFGLAKLIAEKGEADQIIVGGSLPLNLINFGWETSPLKESDFEQALVILLDTATLSRIDFDGLNASVLQNARQIIKIDHHPVKEDEYPENTQRYIDTEASSTSEVLCKLFEINGNDVSLELAQYLYTGIIGDTGNFSYGFSSQTFVTTAQLVAGHDIQKFTDINHSLTVSSLDEARMKGYYYTNMQTEDDTAWIIISQQVLKKYSWSAELMSVYVNLLGTIEGIKKWILCIQYDDLSWRLRIRSQNVMINHLAQEYGGGGHPNASGIILQNSKQVEEQIQEIIEKLKKIK
ncbi:bifunctional oligoribonuclease/PAP phosphatase NrnA [Ligilactobacillus equi]|uniref:DHH family phosphoesterase n=1 Tax=Ligilactobacillus equi TaxID=137357 RepID=UPI002ED105C1